MRTRALGFYWAMNANQSRRIDVNGPVADGARRGSVSQGRWQHFGSTIKLIPPSPPTSTDDLLDNTS